MLEVELGRPSGKFSKSFELEDLDGMGLSTLGRREEFCECVDPISTLLRRVGLGSNKGEELSRSLGLFRGTSITLGGLAGGGAIGPSSLVIVVVTCSSGRLFRSMISILGRELSFGGMEDAAS